MEIANNILYYKIIIYSKYIKYIHIYYILNPYNNEELKKCI